MIVIGSSNTDMVVKMDRLPRPGETVMGHHFFTAAGGKGANQAVAAARCGGKVVFVARVGEDTLGQAAIDGFAREGIDIACISRDPDEPSGVAQIMVDEKGENCIAVAPGANMSLTPAVLEPIWSDIKNSSLILMQLETPLQTIYHVVQEADIDRTKIILNPAPATDIDLSLLQGLYLITPNLTEAAKLSGMSLDSEAEMVACGEKLRSEGIQHVIITLGSKGCVWFHKHGHQFFDAFSVKALDTTAAGDVFNGALAVALFQNYSFPDAIHYASAAAAISVTRLGAQDSAPYQSEINAFVKDRK